MSLFANGRNARNASRSWIGSMGTVLCLLALLGGVSGCGSRIISPYDLSNYVLVEFERRQIAVRLLDESGQPIRGRQVRFFIEGNANGAVLEQIVAETDEQGVARVMLRTQFEAQFNIVAEANGALPFIIPVSVSRANGGTLQLTVFTRSAASIGDAQLILVENFTCAEFDPERPPAPDPQSIAPSQNVVATPSGSPAVIRGLREGIDYAVIALGVGGGQTRGRACKDGIRVTKDMIDRRIAFTDTLFLEDFSPDLSGNELIVETQFSFPLRLVQIARLYEEMSDSPNDPVDYIIEQAVANSNNSYLASYLAALKDRLAPRIYNASPQAQIVRAKLGQFAQKIRAIQNVRMWTSMEFRDENTIAAGGVAAHHDDGHGEHGEEPHPGEPSVFHRFRYFTADIGGRQEQYYIREGQRVGAGNLPPENLILEAQATVDFSDASRVKIGLHQLSVPVTDTIISQLLWETFSNVDIRAILSGAVKCDVLVQQALEILFGPAAGGALGLIVGPALDGGCRQVALDTLDETFERVNAEMRASGLGTVVDFDGSATLEKLADNRTILRLINGRWLGVGLFSAERL